MKPRVDGADLDAERGRDRVAWLALELEENEHRPAFGIHLIEDPLHHLTRFDVLERHAFGRTQDVDQIVEELAIATHAPMARFRFHRDSDRDRREPRPRLRRPRLVAPLPMGDEENLLDRIVDLGWL
jgi:hypothetical protein